MAQRPVLESQGLMSHLQVEHILQIRPIQIAPSQLHKAKRPIWLQVRSSDDLRVILADNLFGSASAQEVEIEAPSNSAVSNMILSK